jgi:hypothetical protein
MPTCEEIDASKERMERMEKLIQSLTARS